EGARFAWKPKSGKSRLNLAYQMAQRGRRLNSHPQNTRALLVWKEPEPLEFQIECSSQLSSSKSRLKGLQFAALRFADKFQRDVRVVRPDPPEPRREWSQLVNQRDNSCADFCGNRQRDK